MSVPSKSLQISEKDKQKPVNYQHCTVTNGSYTCGEHSSTAYRPVGSPETNGTQCVDYTPIKKKTKHDHTVGESNARIQEGRLAQPKESDTLNQPQAGDFPPS